MFRAGPFLELVLNRVRVVRQVESLRIENLGTDSTTQMDGGETVL